MSLSSDEIELEEAHRLQVIQSIRQGYIMDSLSRISKYKKDWRGLSEHERALCPEYAEKLSKITRAVQTNHQALNIVMSIQESTDGFTIDDEKKALFAENTRSLLRQLVREWSLEGKEERMPYMHLIDKLSQYSFRKASVLVPGAGLGRLPWELVIRGYNTEANEFSHFMILPSQYILNYCQENVVIHPYVFPLSNCFSTEDQLRTISFPDIFPSTHEGDVGSFGYVAGDFVQVYQQPENHLRFDAVITCFFLDTAKNIFEYMKVIDHVLKTDGIWLNYGPLLYHFEGSTEVSLELTAEELLKAIGRFGFEILEHSKDFNSKYVQNPRSMLQNEYNCIFFVCRKKSNK